jgi:hypothetical protein
MRAKRQVQHPALFYYSRRFYEFSKNSRLLSRLHGLQEIQELPNGWAWRLPSTPEILMLLAEDLNMERLCCPFVHYTLEIGPNHAPFWLYWTGGDGVKEFLWMGFESVNLFDPQVAKAAGLNVPADAEMDFVETALEAVDSLNERYARIAGSG